MKNEKKEDLQLFVALALWAGVAGLLFVIIAVQTVELANSL